MHTPNGNAEHDDEPTTDPVPVTDSMLAVARDAVELAKKVDTLIVDQRTTSAHVRSIEGAIAGLAEMQESDARENRKALEIVRNEVTAHRRDVDRMIRQTEQRRIEQARTSSPNLDAQALSQTIESFAAVTNGTLLSIVSEVKGLRRDIGAEPNANLGVEGSGVIGRVAKLERDRFRLLAIVSAVALVLTAAASALAFAKNFGG